LEETAAPWSLATSLLAGEVRCGQRFVTQVEIIYFMIYSNLFVRKEKEA
jgi:hypothetical protein